MAMRTSDWPIAVKQLDVMTVPTIFCSGGSETLDQPALNPSRMRMSDNLLSRSPDWLLTGGVVLVFGLLSPLVSMCIIRASPPCRTYWWIWSRQTSFPALMCPIVSVVPSLRGVCVCIFFQFLASVSVVPRKVSLNSSLDRRSLTETEKERMQLRQMDVSLD